MTPAQRLSALLETLPTEDRQEVTAWLLDRNRHAEGRTWLEIPSDAGQTARRLTSPLAAGEDTQLVTIRLPADRHAELRDWCAGHGFTMAAVVRGLVDRFIDEQRG